MYVLCRTRQFYRSSLPSSSSCQIYSRYACILIFAFLFLHIFTFYLHVVVARERRKRERQSERKRNQSANPETLFSFLSFFSFSFPFFLRLVLCKITSVRPLFRLIFLTRALKLYSYIVTAERSLRINVLRGSFRRTQSNRRTGLAFFYSSRQDTG